MKRRMKITMKMMFDETRLDTKLKHSAHAKELPRDVEGQNRSTRNLQFERSPSQKLAKGHAHMV